MEKAVLVMDMPECCARCRFDTDESDGSCYCSVTNNYYSAYESTINRVDSCPLRELPEKRDCLAEAIKNDCYDGTGYDYAYLEGKSDGWSACLDEILKERDADGTH